MIDVKEICSRAKEASYALSGYTSEQKNGMLDAIADALTEKGNLVRLAEANALDVREAEKKSGVFDGMRIVLTGSLPTYKRGEATALIENNGGEVASSVSKTVDMVLAGEDAGSKLDKAKKLGIKIIDENEFVAMLNGAAKEN